MKRIKLEQLNTVIGRPFRTPELGEDGNPLLEPIKDASGNQVRDASGNPSFRIKSKELGGETLLELLKSLYLNIPPQKLTRQDTIYGVRMFQNIAKATDGYLELDEDVHDWVKKQLQNEDIGVKVFGVNLPIVEEAIESYDRYTDKK